MLNPRDKQLVEIPVAPEKVSHGIRLQLDDYWPSGASEWGQVHLDESGRMLLRDRYGTQCFDLADGRLLWKQDRSEWSLTTRLYPWKGRLYLNQATRGLAWIDPEDGRQHQLEPGTSGNEARFRLYAMTHQFLLHSELKGVENGWFFYRPEEEIVQKIPLCPSWCEAGVSSCGAYLTLSRHHVPPGQEGNVLLLDSAGQPQRHWLLPGCSQVQAEPGLKLIFGVAMERLLVYDFEGQLRHCFQGHGGAIVGFRVECTGGYVLSWDEFGWVRRWSLGARSPLDSI